MTTVLRRCLVAMAIVTVPAESGAQTRIDDVLVVAAPEGWVVRQLPHGTTTRGSITVDEAMRVLSIDAPMLDRKVNIRLDDITAVLAESSGGSGLLSWRRDRLVTVHYRLDNGTPAAVSLRASESSRQRVLNQLQSLSDIPIDRTPARQSFAALARQVRIGSYVEVLDDSGRPQTGRVAGLSATSIDLSEGRSFAANAVREVRWRDPWFDGVLRGLAVGMFGLAPAYALLSFERCFSESPPECHRPYVPMIVGAALVGGLADLAAPATVFQRPSQESRRRVSLQPHVTNRRKGVSLAVRF